MTFNNLALEFIENWTKVDLLAIIGDLLLENGIFFGNFYTNLYLILTDKPYNELVFNSIVGQENLSEKLNSEGVYTLHLNLASIYNLCMLENSRFYGVGFGFIRPPEREELFLSLKLLGLVLYYYRDYYKNKQYLRIYRRVWNYVFDLRGEKFKWIQE